MFGRSKSRQEGPSASGAEGVAEAEELSDEERSSRLAALVELIEMMRPAVQADGGDLVLVDADVAEGRVEVMLQGSCSSCAISSVTLQAGVERILTQRLPWVRSVVGRLDETLEWEQSMALGQGGYVPRLH